MPALINEIQDREFTAKWKKAYATISNAVYNASEDYEFCKGTNIDYNGDIKLCSEERVIETYQQIISKLDLVDVCRNGTGIGYEMLGIRTCRSDEFKHIKDKVSPKCKSLSGDFDGYCANDAGIVAKLKDGIWLYFAAPVWNSPKVLIDVNGASAPNTIGRDMFVVILIKNKAIAYGSKEYGKDTNGCDKNAVSEPLFGSFNYANASGLAGAGCSSEYLYK